jgi:HD-like signal output (HDOD) protein
MSTKVLQLVNSAFFGLPRAITDPQEAVIYLGLDCLRYVFITAEMLESLRVDTTTTRVADRLQAHASIRADLAFELATMAGHRTRSAREIWVGAFLADVGAIAISMSNPQFAAWLLDATTDEDRDGMEELDQLVPAAGGYLLSIWGLPHQIVESVVLSRSRPSADTAHGAGFIWLADVLAGADRQVLDDLDDGVLEAMGMTRELLSDHAGSVTEGSGS